MEYSETVNNRPTYKIRNLSESTITTIKDYAKANKMTIAGAVEKLVARGEK